MEKRVTKTRLIDEIFDLCDKSQGLHSAGLKELYDANKITPGSFYYLLNIHREMAWARFFGCTFAGETKVSMANHKANYKVSEFLWVKKDFEKMIKMQELTIELGVHDLGKCHAIQFERVGV